MLFYLKTPFLFNSEMSDNFIKIVFFFKSINTTSTIKESITFFLLQGLYVPVDLRASSPQFHENQQFFLWPSKKCPLFPLLVRRTAVLSQPSSILLWRTSTSATPVWTETQPQTTDILCVFYDWSSLCFQWKSWWDLGPVSHPNSEDLYHNFYFICFQIHF